MTATTNRHLQLTGRPGPLTPQPGVPRPEDGLPVRPTGFGPKLWVVGAHGGSGESTVAQLHYSWWHTGHSWPEVLGDDRDAILVARTSAWGLLAAQAALAQWAASGAGNVALLGLVLIADTPGRLPRPLRELAELVAGGAPRVWTLPWIEAWRIGEPPTVRSHPRARALVDELLAVGASAAHAHSSNKKENNHGS